MDSYWSSVEKTNAHVLKVSRGMTTWLFATQRSANHYIFNLSISNVQVMSFLSSVESSKVRAAVRAEEDLIWIQLLLLLNSVVYVIDAYFVLTENCSMQRKGQIDNNKRTAMVCETTKTNRIDFGKWLWITVFKKKSFVQNGCETLRNMRGINNQKWANNNLYPLSVPSESGQIWRGP